MTAAVQALQVLLPVVYMALTLLYGMELAGPRAPKWARWRRGTTAFAVLLHLGYGAVLSTELGHLPIAHPWQVVSFLGFSILGLYLLIEPLAKTPATGAFVVLAVFVMQLMASALAPLQLVASPLAQSRFFVVHIVSALLAVAALLLSGFFSGLYLVLLRQLRRRTFGVLYAKLPDLERLSKMNRAAAAVGFLFLTVGLNLGIWWAHEGAVRNFSYLDPKVWPAIVLWLVFGVISVSGFLRFLSGRRAAWIAVVAASLLLLSLGVSLVPRGAFHVFR